MININAVQNFCDCLENAYCKTLQESWDDKNITLSLDKESGMIQVCRSSYVEDSISPADNRIKTIMTEDKKNDVINYMADILEANNVFDDDTVAAFFVSCCYFGYMWDIFPVNETDKVIGFFCSSFEDDKVKGYLSLLGRGILNRGYNSKLSTELIEKAIEMNPDNEMSKLFDFVLKCVSFDKYITDIMQDYVRNEEEYNSFVDTVNNYMAALSESLNRVDRYLQSFILNHNEAADKIGNSFCTLNYCLYLPNIKSNHIMYGLLESQTAFKNQLLFVDPDLRKTMIKGSMPSHPDYLLENYVSMESISYDDKKTYMFFGSTLVVDIFETRDFYRIYGALLNQYKKLKETNKKLERLQRERKNLIDYHKHNWKYMIYPGVVEGVAQELLEAGDEDKANKLFYAYNAEMLLKNDLKLLELEYENDPKHQIELMRKSMLRPSARGTKAVNIYSIFCSALDNVVFRTVMTDVDTSNEITYVRNNLASNNFDMSKIRGSYVQTFWKNGRIDNDEKIINWFSENFFKISCSFEKCEDGNHWKKIKFRAGDTSWTKFMELFINLINNALKYGKDHLDVNFGKCSQYGEVFYTITMSNIIDPEPGCQEGEHIGLNNIDAFFKSINAVVCKEDLGIKTSIENGVFSITVFITEKVFI